MVVQRHSGRSIRVYSEKQLDRKMRDEHARLPVVSEDAPSDRLCRSIELRYLAFVARTAKLSPIERKVFILGVNRASLRQIAAILGISRQRAAGLLFKVKCKLARVKRSKYYGLHEVYWQEVRRNIYRKPRRNDSA